MIIDFVDPPAVRSNLGDGFRVDSRIIVWEQDDVLKVPTSALFRVGQDWQLFLVRDNVARQTPVELGQNNGIEAQILSGLVAGDSVIVHPSDSVKDGVTTALRNES